MNWNREAVAIAVVGAGGAWMLGSALLSSRAQRLNAVQRRGLVLSGMGFLITAAAARWLQGYGHIGIACSLAGTAIAMIGMYKLVKERAELRQLAEQDATRLDTSE